MLALVQICTALETNEHRCEDTATCEPRPLREHRVREFRYYYNHFMAELGAKKTNEQITTTKGHLVTLCQSKKRKRKTGIEGKGIIKK